MAKKKSQPKPRKGLRFAQIATGLALGLAVGGFVGYQVGTYQAHDNTGGSETDRYGRTPDDPHYGHDHP